jgi:hypothetical protein
MNTGQPYKIDRKGKSDSMVRSWLMVLSISLIFFLWGMLIYFTVGISWPPPWRYGTVPDVPGQSVYSVQNAEERAGTAFSPGNKTQVQHVMGDREEKGRSGEGK